MLPNAYLYCYMQQKCAQCYHVTNSTVVRIIYSNSSVHENLSHQSSSRGLEKFDEKIPTIPKL